MEDKRRATDCAYVTPQDYLGVLKNFEVSSASTDYRATYRDSKNTVTVRRELKDKKATNVCTPQVMA